MAKFSLTVFKTVWLIFDSMLLFSYAFRTNTLFLVFHCSSLLYPIYNSGKVFCKTLTSFSGKNLTFYSWQESSKLTDSCHFQWLSLFLLQRQLFWWRTWAEFFKSKITFFAIIDLHWRILHCNFRGALEDEWMTIQEALDNSIFCVMRFFIISINGLIIAYITHLCPIKYS